MLNLSQNLWNNLRESGKLRGLDDLERMNIRLPQDKIVEFEINRFINSLEFSLLSCDEFYDKVKDFIHEFSDFEISWFYLDYEASFILLGLYDTIGFEGKIFKDIRNITDYYPVFYTIKEEYGFMPPLLDYITEKYRTYNVNKGFKITDKPSEEDMSGMIWKLLDKTGYFNKEGGEIHL